MNILLWSLIFLVNLVLFSSPTLFARDLLLLKMFLACFCIFFLPGRLILKSLNWDNKLDAIETIPVSFALGSLITLTLSVMVFLLHLNMTFACCTLYLLTGLILIFNIYKKKRDDKVKIWSNLKKYDHCELFMIAIIGFLTLIIFSLLYDIGSPVLGKGVHRENVLHAITMKKIATSPALHLDEITYKKGIYQTYIIPQWHFMVALVSRAANIDVLIIYERMRCFLFLFMLTLYYSFAKIFIGRRFSIFFILFLLIMLMAGDYSDYYYSTHNPIALFTHPGQIGYSICSILLIVCTMHIIKENIKNMLLIMPFIVLSMTMIQGRQGLQFIYHIGLLMLFYWSFNRDLKKGASRSLLIKLCLLILGTIILGFIYKMIHSHLVSTVAEWEKVEYSRSFLPLWDRIKGNWRYAIDYFGRRNPFSGAGSQQLWSDFYIVLAFICLPVIILFKERLFALLAFSCMFSAILMVKIPIISLLVTKVTYSEFLQSPMRYFYWISVTIFILILYLYLISIDRLISRFSKMKIPIIAGNIIFVYFILFPFLFILPKIESWQNIFFWILIIISIISYHKSLKYSQYYREKTNAWISSFSGPIVNKGYFNTILVIMLVIYVLQSQNFPFSTYHWNTRFSTIDKRRAEGLISAKNSNIDYETKESEIKVILEKLKKPLWAIYRESYESGRTRTTTVKDLYTIAQRELGNLPPYELINFLNNLPQGMVMAYPLEKWDKYQPIFILPLFTNHFIFSSGNIFSVELQFKASYPPPTPLFFLDYNEKTITEQMDKIKKMVLKEKIDLIIVPPRYLHVYREILKRNIISCVLMNVIWDNSEYMIIQPIILRQSS